VYIEKRFGSSVDIKDNEVWQRREMARTSVICDMQGGGGKRQEKVLRGHNDRKITTSGFKGATLISRVT